MTLNLMTEIRVCYLHLCRLLHYHKERSALFVLYFLEAPCLRNTKMDPRTMPIEKHNFVLTSRVFFEPLRIITFVLQDTFNVLCP